MADDRDSIIEALKSNISEKMVYIEWLESEIRILKLLVSQYEREKKRLYLKE